MTRSSIDLRFGNPPRSQVGVSRVTQRVWCSDALQRRRSLSFSLFLPRRQPNQIAMLILRVLAKPRVRPRYTRLHQAGLERAPDVRYVPDDKLRSSLRSGLIRVRSLVLDDSPFETVEPRSQGGRDRNDRSPLARLLAPGRVEEDQALTTASIALRYGCTLGVATHGTCGNFRERPFANRSAEFGNFSLKINK